VNAHGLLAALVVVLGVAAVTTVLFQRLRQPVVLGYVLAGLIVGPHVPVPLVADRAVVQTLSELGVILLMFSLGLEFSLRSLARVGPPAAITAAVQSSLMVWLGYVVGRALGFTVLESVFTGAMVAMSSTTIIAKAFDELRVRGPVRDLVVGVLLVEDLFAVVFMAVLTAVATGAGVSPGAVGATLGKLAAFLVALIGVGMLTVPRGIRYVRRLDRPETLLVASLGLCFGIAWLAQAFGYSVALGAFLAGSLIAESGEPHEVEKLVRPVRDMFAAVFFVSVGMLLDPALVARHWGSVLALVALVAICKPLTVALGAFLTGSGTRGAVQAGMSLGQIGEFSFILAALGSSLGATRPFLYPVIVAVSAVTTLTTPWAIQASGTAAAWVDRRLPGPVQTSASLYGSWLERFRASSDRTGLGARIRRMVRAIVVDAVLVSALAIGAAVAIGPASTWLRRAFGLGPDLPWAAVVVATALVAAPFCVGLVSNARKLGLAIASAALPEVDPGRPDLAAAPRRALLAMLQLGVAILVLAPIVAVTQPFLPGALGPALLGVTIFSLGIAFWRSAADLQGHVRASAQVIVEALARRGAAPGPETPDALGALRALLPGMGEPIAIRITPGSPAVGKTLAALEVRGRTGATVLAIARPDGSAVYPTATEVLREGDTLAVAGAHEAVEAARELLGAVEGVAAAGRP
jgi:CPA2 family monovalent cation:H+ antiporter-2